MRFYLSEKNVGSWDRLLRLIVGPVLLVVAVTAALGAIALSPVLVAASAIVGAILTVTGLTQKCPLNNLLGIDTYGGREPTAVDSEQEVVERPA